MSTMDENIYNLIPREYVKPAQRPKYQSVFRQNVRKEFENKKADRKTMGEVEKVEAAPYHFLKKTDKTLPEKMPFSYQDNASRKPPVPAKDDRPVMGMKTTKNLINQNAINNIMSVPRKPARNYVDTCKGDKQKLLTSGMELRYAMKKDYGEVPTYLLKREAEMARAQEEYDAYVAEHFRAGAMKQVSADERSEILDGLKTNWERIHKEYQGLSVVTDTAPKKNRKERMEADMRQLERDIESIEKHTVIYIANN